MQLKITCHSKTSIKLLISLSVFSNCKSKIILQLISYRFSPIVICKQKVCLHGANIIFRWCVRRQIFIFLWPNLEIWEVERKQVFLFNILLLETHHLFYCLHVNVLVLKLCWHVECEISHINIFYRASLVFII
jgi:hypothetical protein